MIIWIRFESNEDNKISKLKGIMLSFLVHPESTLGWASGVA